MSDTDIAYEGDLCTYILWSREYAELRANDDLSSLKDAVVAWLYMEDYGSGAPFAIEAIKTPGQQGEIFTAASPEFVEIEQEFRAAREAARNASEPVAWKIFVLAPDGDPENVRQWAVYEWGSDYSEFQSELDFLTALFGQDRIKVWVADG